MTGRVGSALAPADVRAVLDASCPCAECGQDCLPDADGLCGDCAACPGCPDCDTERAP